MVNAKLAPPRDRFEDLMDTVHNLVTVMNGGLSLHGMEINQYREHLTRMCCAAKPSGRGAFVCQLDNMFSRCSKKISGTSVVYATGDELAQLASIKLLLIELYDEVSAEHAISPIAV